MAEYLKRDIAKILKKPPRTIEWWTSSGLVVPDIEPSQGKGKPRVFSDRNLLEFAMIETMTRMGVSLETIQSILAVLREGKWAPEVGPPFGASGSELSEVSKKVLKEWQDENTLRFKSFWNGKEWGDSKELVYVSGQTMGSSGRLGGGGWWHVLEGEKEEDGRVSFDTTEIHSPQNDLFPILTIIWLGQIKKYAMQLVLG